MSDFENSNVINNAESNEKPEQKVEVETNGQLRIVFKEDYEENDKDPNQDELYKFEPEKEPRWNR